MWCSSHSHHHCLIKHPVAMATTYWWGTQQGSSINYPEFPAIDPSPWAGWMTPRLAPLGRHLTLVIPWISTAGDVVVIRARPPGAKSLSSFLLFLRSGKLGRSQHSQYGGLLHWSFAVLWRRAVQLAIRSATGTPNISCTIFLNITVIYQKL